MFQIITQNVRGLRDLVKMKEVFYHLRPKADVICIQETHFDKNQENFIRSNWGGEVFFSHGTTAARGVAILLK